MYSTLQNFLLLLSFALAIISIHCETESNAVEIWAHTVELDLILN